MLNGRCQRHRDHEQGRLPMELGHHECRHGHPACFGDRAVIHHPTKVGHGVTCHHTRQNGQQAEDAMSKHSHDKGGHQRTHGNQHRLLIGEQLKRTIPALAHRHIDRNRRQTQADDHDDRPCYHWWHDSVQKTDPLELHRQCQQHVDTTGSHQTAHRSRHTPVLY